MGHGFWVPLQKHPTGTDAVVGYQTVMVQAWDAVAPTEFSTNRRLRTHIPDITHPTLYTSNAPFTMLGMGCSHPSFHNSYPVATHDIPNSPIVTEEGFAAAGHGRVHAPHHLPPVQVPPGVPGHSGGLSR